MFQPHFEIIHCYQDPHLFSSLDFMLSSLQSPVAVNQSPALREKAFLLIKLMNNVEKRFQDDNELNAQFLELIHYLYK